MLQVKVGMSSILQKKATHMGILGYGGYLFFNMNKELYPVHKFVWECFHGVQPEGKVVVHINGDKRHNKIVTWSLPRQMKTSCSFTKY